MREDGLHLHILCLCHDPLLRLGHTPLDVGRSVENLRHCVGDSLGWANPPKASEASWSGSSKSATTSIVEPAGRAMGCSNQ